MNIEKYSLKDHLLAQTLNNLYIYIFQDHVAMVIIVNYILTISIIHVVYIDNHLL